ncbi:MAG: DUF559 domain-containing protein [Acidimicrobiales bacterium]
MGDLELAAIGATQLGLVTRAQARDHLSRKELESRLATGRLEVLRRGVYRFAGAPATPWQPLLAACLAAGPAAVASCHSAAELWALPGVVADRLEITVPAPMWLRLPGVRGHQSTLLPTAHCTVRNDVPVTTPARTLIDLSRTGLEVGLVGRLVDDCLRRRLLVLDDLRDAYELLAAPGRRSLPIIRTVLESRGLGFQPGDSEPELRVWRWLVDAGLPAPVLQHQVPAGGTVYVIDLAYPDLQVGVEYDGWAWHGGRSAFDHDARRSNALAAAGWTLVRVTSATTPADLVASVRALRARTPAQV